MTILFLCSKGRQGEIGLDKDGIVPYTLNGAPGDIDKLGALEAEDPHITGNKDGAYLPAGKVYQKIADIPKLSAVTYADDLFFLKFVYGATAPCAL